ncbi:NifX-associated nitrogen fixation protein [Acetobacter lambici]|uniref:NifX-associated nitrogen fixation protein n=1 Tax=Acetobacter lambici TaxID=1332824 RepID=A0ABT1EYX2_9PROT|nr:NifX-associated nitrogen fixation protein [Acetobacter lambici]MCP1242174.1 NifX-associated nitrogen fixation protein [Acetobacter lambici]MCP1258142.1 NifX-associated nitrogen fixation protein [Acetobacter lambici]NHO56032.1 NifX-associated nitrogen fixation protein [Acetobacter lambici]
MSHEVSPATLVQEEDPMKSPFLRALIGRIRAEDSFGAWENKPDEWLLRDYIVSREEKRAMPIISDPDPDVISRVEHFYQAVGLAVEQNCGLMASPMMKMSHEGFGRVILTTGRLVIFSKTLRDVHRFGFENLEALSNEGMKAVRMALDVIGEYPDVANA